MGERSRPASARSPAQIVLAFDFGLKRIGIAVGDTLTGTAAPRPAALVHASGPDWAAIAREVAAAQPQRLIVGLPLDADGRPGALAPAVRDFARALGARFGLAVEPVNEWGSSLEASAALKQRRATGMRARRVQRADIDSAAAAIILERYLAGERTDRPEREEAGHE
jgi:putative holliday junction resolvase